MLSPLREFQFSFPSICVRFGALFAYLSCRGVHQRAHTRTTLQINADCGRIIARMCLILLIGARAKSSCRLWPFDVHRQYSIPHVLATFGPGTKTRKPNFIRAPAHTHARWHQFCLAITSIVHCFLPFKGIDAASSFWLLVRVCVQATRIGLCPMLCCGCAAAVHFHK